MDMLHERQSDMENPNESTEPMFFRATIPFFVLMVFFYIARIYSRLRPVVRFHWDDFVITLAFVRVVGTVKKLRT
jgi:hypothetical protein